MGDQEQTYKTSPKAVCVNFLLPKLHCLSWQLHVDRREGKKKKEEKNEGKKEKMKQKEKRFVHTHSLPKQSIFYTLNNITMHSFHGHYPHRPFCC